MKKIEILGTIFVAFFILMVGCGGCSDPSPQTTRPKPKPMNIIVILDTSDRISNRENPIQIKRDIVIAKGITNLYYEHVLRQRGDWRNRIAFVVPPQFGASKIPSEIVRQLEIWPTIADERAGRKRLDEMKKKLDDAIDELYQELGNTQAASFTGSDIWSWFRDSAEVYLKPDARNYVICLSDGYLDFNRSIQIERPERTYISYREVAKLRETPNWKSKFHTEGHGLLGIEKDFSGYGVKFLMVEIKHRHMLDFEIVKEYWRTWLKSMGITDSQFLPTQDVPEIVIEKIKEFISTE